MPINQLADEGSVIGYKPELEYKKELNNEHGLDNASTPEENANRLNQSTLKSYSAAVQAFIESSPSSTIGKLEDTVHYLQDLTDKLTQSFKDGNWDEYNDISMLMMSLESGNAEFYDEFVKYHSTHLNASIIPELIMELYGQQHRVETLISTMKELFYGKDNIALEECVEYDTAHIQQIKTYEELGQTEKINYMAISMDAMMCHTIGMHSYGLNKKAIALAKIGTDPNDSFTSNTGRDTITELYEEINTDIANRKHTYETQNSIEVVQQALYNYYNKRKASILVASLFSESNESIPMGRRLQAKQSELNDAVANIARAIKSNELYISKLTELEYEKRFLMDVYSRFNYNLENN